MLRVTFLVVCATVLLTACASVDVVSKSPDQIAIVANNSHEMDNAHRKADRYCREFGRNARLDRTEAVDKGAVAYFVCT